MADLHQRDHPADEATDVPGLSTWPAVYTFVVGAFLLWVALLTALMRAYS